MCGARIDDSKHNIEETGEEGTVQAQATPYIISIYYTIELLL